jgi:glycosyltransferase involved in cell wall biosynthesis
MPCPPRNFPPAGSDAKPLPGLGDRRDWHSLMSMCEGDKQIVCHISTVHTARDVRVYYRECCSLAAAGFKVYLVIGAQKAETHNGVTVVPIAKAGNRIWRALVMPWVAMSKALQTKADIYHYHDPELLPMGFVLRWVFGKRVVYDIHESVPRQILSKTHFPRLLRKPIAICYRIVERMLGAGQALVIANQHCVPDYPKTAHLVQNYPALDERTEAIRQARPKRAEPPSLVYVGGVNEGRGSMLYVELAAELRRRGVTFQVTLIGEHSSEHGAQLKAKAGELGVESLVEVTGRMDWPEAMERVSRASIGLCLLMPIPNYTTCLATKILEYMMLGVPVLASSFDVWRPYVEGERTGLMADPTNLREVADACQRMLSDPTELEAMGRRGILAVQERYNWSVEFRQLLECYRRVLNFKSPRAEEVARVPGS